MSPKKRLVMISFKTTSLESTRTNKYYSNGLLRDKYFHRGNNWNYSLSRDLQSFNHDYEIECWNIYNPEDYGRSDIFRVNENNVIYRQFPVKRLINGFFPLAMLIAFISFLRSKPKAVVHFEKVHGIIPTIFALFCYSVPLLGHQRGPDCPTIWSLKYKLKGGALHYKKSFLFLILSYFIQMVSINNFDMIFSSSLGEYIFLKNRYPNIKTIRLKGSTFDFNKYKLSGDIDGLRKSLRIDKDSRMIIYVGHYTPIKGLELVLNDFEERRKRDSNCVLYLFGGYESDSLYEKTKLPGVVEMGVVEKDTLMKYIEAADLFLMPTTERWWIPFSDVPTSIIESLSLNTRVLSKTMIHIERIKKFGKYIGYQNFSSLKEGIDISLNRDASFNSRMIMEKLYNTERIVHKHLNCYEQEYANYYEN